MSKKPNTGRRGLGFSGAEIQSLLDFVEEIIPIGTEQWNAVEQRYIVLFPETNRNATRMLYQHVINHLVIFIIITSICFTFACYSQL